MATASALAREANEDAAPRFFYLRLRADVADVVGAREPLEERLLLALDQRRNLTVDCLPYQLAVGSPYQLSQSGTGGRPCQSRRRRKPSSG